MTLALRLAIPMLAALSSCHTSPSGPPGDLSLSIPGSSVQFEMAWVPTAGVWFGKTEVTWDEYLIYCNFDGEVDGVTRPSKPLDDVTPFDRDWGLGRRPAVGISRNAAKQYCRWLSDQLGRTFRLPTEAEWLAACGPAPTRPVAEVAWCAENSDEMTQEVGARPANEFGLHDMLGNLWEYCSDPYSAAEPDRAVLRGGCFEDPATAVSPASRLGFEADWVLADPNVPPGVWWVPDGDNLGFRIVCERTRRP